MPIDHGYRSYKVIPIHNQIKESGNRKYSKVYPNSNLKTYEQSLDEYSFKNDKSPFKTQILSDFWSQNMGQILG